MPYLFQYFPKVLYDTQKNNKRSLLTNITARFNFKDKLNERGVVTYDYLIQDTDRPDIIAYKYYGDSSLDWVILITNAIIDIRFDWPLTQADLEAYIKQKYGSIAAAQAQTHHYEYIQTAQSIRADGSVIAKIAYEVDSNTYATLAPTNRRAVSAYTYEVEKNDDKRKISIVDKKYIPTIIRQAQSVFE